MRSRWTIVARAVAALCALALAAGAFACKSRPTETLRTGPLFERVGKEAGIHRAVEAIAAAVAQSPELAEAFSEVDMEGFRRGLAAFLCARTAGPCEYHGRLADAWAGAELDEERFVLLMEAIVAGFNEARVPQQEQNDLLDLLMQAHDAELAAAEASATAAAAE
jgi:truncated hemoglobin YjbI